MRGSLAGRPWYVTSITGHFIFEAEHAAGNMGAQVSEYRGFCKCGWDSQGIQNRRRYEAACAAHLHPLITGDPR